MPAVPIRNYLCRLSIICAGRLLCAKPVDPGNEPLLRAEVLHQADRAPAGPLHTLLKPFHLRHVGAAEAIDRLLGVADRDFSLYRVGYRMPRRETVEQEDA